MSNPTVIDVPHSLGREEAKRRMRSRIGELGSHLPGGVADVQASWPGEDRMALDISAMGQRLTATLDVQDDSVRVTMLLPPMLAFMSGAIAKAVERKGTQLLLADDRKA